VQWTIADLTVYTQGFCSIPLIFLLFCELFHYARLYLVQTILLDYVAKLHNLQVVLHNSLVLGLGLQLWLRSGLNLQSTLTLEFAKCACTISKLHGVWHNLQIVQLHSPYIACNIENQASALWGQATRGRGWDTACLRALLMYLCHLIRNRVKISTVKPLLQSVRTEGPLLEVKDSQDKAFIDIKLRSSVAMSLVVVGRPTTA